MIQNVGMFIEIQTSLLCQYGVNRYICGPVLVALFFCANANTLIVTAILFPGHMGYATTSP